MPNIYSDIPENIPDEIFNDILVTNSIRIERIISNDHSSPKNGWYDQTENEWVIVIEGKGTIEFCDGKVVTLNKGDYINIKAGEKHKVLNTHPEEVTIWLAIFYS